jgi:hypothetical protein
MKKMIFWPLGFAVSSMVFDGLITQPVLGATTPTLACNGTTNDAPALQALLNAGTGYVYIPPSAKGCLLNSLVTYNASNGPIEIRGEGAASRLLIASTSGGLQISAPAGMGYQEVYLVNFKLQAQANAAYAVQLNGLAAWGLLNVDVVSVPGGYQFNHGIDLEGSQQGYIHGGLSYQNATGIYLNDLSGPPGLVSSNGVHIGDGRTFTDLTAAVDIEGGASDVWVNNAHITGAQYGIIVDQTNALGGAGFEYLTNLHIENASVWGIEVRSGVAKIEDLNDYDVSAVHVTNGGWINISKSLLNGTVKTDSGTTGEFTYNLVWGALSNGGATLCASHNMGNGFPTITKLCN